MARAHSWKWLALTLGLAAPALLACGGASVEPHAAAPPARHAAWTYGGATGPDRWGELDPSFAACSTGKKQSPIDLPRAADVAAPFVLTPPHWNAVPVRAVNNGHTVQVDVPAGSSLSIDGAAYALAQFHFHAPAEHTVEGRAYDAEVHFVHRAQDGKIAVVALLFTRGAASATLAPLFDAMPKSAGEPVEVPGKSLDVAALLPRAPHYLTYQGSLTTPPCTEGVTWLVVMPEPGTGSELSDAQLATLRAAVHAPSNRPLQPRNDRPVAALQ